MVPDKLPATAKEVRREQTLQRIRTNLANATSRLNAFLEETPQKDVIKRLHTGKTEIINDSDETEIVDYFSLWTDFADIRLSKSGTLLRSDYEEKWADEKTLGFDKSEVLSIYDMRQDPSTYTAARLASLAEKLDHFLSPQNK